jgi:hypothetical protein
MNNNEIEIKSFGDVRSLIIDTILGIRNGSYTATDALAIAANFKVLNDNINAEINATKVSLLAEKEGHNFGKIVSMGTRMIGSNLEE